MDEWNRLPVDRIQCMKPANTKMRPYRRGCNYRDKKKQR